MNVRKMFKLASKFWRKHGSLILHVSAGVGVAATAYLSGKAAVKLHETPVSEDASKVDVIVNTAKIVAGAGIAGGLTIAAIAGGYSMDKKAKAALTGLYLATAESFRQYRELNKIKAPEIDKEITTELMCDGEKEYKDILIDDYEQEMAYGEQNFEILVDDPEGRGEYSFSFRANTLDVKDALFDLQTMLQDRRGSDYMPLPVKLWDDFLDVLGCEWTPEVEGMGWSVGYLEEHYDVASLHITVPELHKDNVVGYKWVIKFRHPPSLDIDNEVYMLW